MTEDSVEVLANGVRHFKKNPILLAPFICMLIVFIIISILESAVLGIYISNFIGSFFQATNDIYYSLFMLLVYAVVLLLVSSYFGAGLIGMSKSAVTTGKTSFSDMTTYGKKGFLKFFELTLAFIVLSLLSLIFFIPLFLQLGSFEELLSEYLLIGIIAMLAKLDVAYWAFSAGFILTILYLLVLWAFFFYAYYAVVIDDVSVVDALKKSVSLLKNKKALGFIVILVILPAILINGCSIFIWMFALLGPLAILGLLVYGILAMVILTYAYICGARMFMVAEERPIFDTRE
ncbi:hypothetical protein [Methanolapillus ohkumae]|uniref:DUF7847 domain-containing protein n=1 Tax=Methanolapillus ohkumae TaxID=3028298 RepID=A0AA96VEK7_9EURY|nr:hypothetical protein MsAm2_06790 [Methanosarcinaceae archaeon Am2]